jgi:hypothetical protein
VGGGGFAGPVSPPLPASAVVVLPPPPTGTGSAVDDVRNRAVTAFSAVAAVEVPRADQLDGLWSVFVASCDVTVTARYEDGREWFAFWDEGFIARDTDDACQTQADAIILLGESIKQRIASAETDARRAYVLPGTLRDVLRQYRLAWAGWDQRPPRLYTRPNAQR